MDNSRFDHVTRMFATATSRRKLIRAGLAGVAATWFDDVFLNGVNAKDKGKPKAQGNGNGKGKDKSKPKKPDKGGGNEKVSICHNGHTIEVAQPAVQAHLDHGDSMGPCAEHSQEQPEPSVAQIPSVHVSVECAYSADNDQTTCTCTATADENGSEVTIRSLLVPAAEVCSDIVGGEFTEVATSEEGQQAGYRSKGDDAQVTLVVSGRVTTGGTASYWCSTNMGLVPAPGPGFICVEPQTGGPATATPASEISDSTGAIIIEAYSCDSAVSTPTTSSNWYDQCQTPESQLNLKLTAGSGTPVSGGLTEETDISGRTVFTQLPSGSYTLDAVSTNWCHAESDSVDGEGNLLVRAGTYCHVWIFFCGRTSGS